MRTVTQVGNYQYVKVVGSNIAIGESNGNVEAGQHGIAIGHSASLVCTLGYGISIQTGDPGVADTGRKGIAISTNGCAQSGDCGYSIVREEGFATVGSYGVACGESKSFVKTGDHGIAIVIAKPDYVGTITSKGGTAIVGAGGIAIVDLLGHAQAGVCGVLIFKSSWDTFIHPVGEDGVLPDTLYSLDRQFRLVKYTSFKNLKRRTKF